ncbi:MAG: GatB/YqeY domain-containing protein [Candidatus Cloacimonetes bacterium]|nr:GatB/YqeY domain-containing protein [Candidatus Cloacimonadota bacterium]
MIERISADLTKAMKTGDKDRLMVLRYLKTEIKKLEVELIRSLSENEILELILRSIKSRQQAMDMYKEGGREDLASQEEKEIGILKQYLPAGLSAEELASAIGEAIRELDASGMKDMGRVIGHLKQKYGTRVDGKALSDAVRLRLSSSD